MNRPHWLPEVVWMGVKVGEWPIHTFTSEEQAQRWAADRNPGDRERRIWSVSVPADTVAYKAEKIPASVTARQVYP